MIAHDVALELAGRFGTPLYAYDLDDVDARCGELHRILPAGAQLFYSLKANPLPVLATSARRAGCRAEISSTGELAVALDAGFDPCGVVFTGPGKDDVELAAALACGIATFSAESWRDLERLSAAACASATTAQVLLRINAGSIPRAGLAMAGRASQFGFDENALAQLGTRMAALSNIAIRGIHVYHGTQVPDAPTLAHTFQRGLEIAERRAGDIPVEVIDLGGGFPWPFATNAAPPDLSALRSSLAALDRERKRTARAELWFESGRYIAASSGTLIANVVDVRRSRETTFVVLDAGVSHLGGMSGLGRILGPTASLVALTASRAGDDMFADVVGPLCTPLDCLARGAVVPSLAPGDLVAVPNTGAYGATASLTGFLSRPPAIEVAIRGRGIVDVARLRGGHEAVTWDTGGLRDDRPVAV